jgi:flavodoxin
MNTLVVYDSQFGNTERIARIIAHTLRASGEAHAARVDPYHVFKTEGLDLLIVGSPTQAFSPTHEMQAFMREISPEVLKGIQVVCFDTRFRGRLWRHSAARYMERQLRAMGIETLVEPESFYVKAMKKQGPLLDGELERAVNWALGVQRRFEMVRTGITAREEL